MKFALLLGSTLLASIMLAGCATGMAGSARRICYDSGLQPGTSEFSACWRGVRDQQFAAELPAIMIGVTAGVAANTPKPAASGAYIPLESGQAPAHPPISVPRIATDHVNRQTRCIYLTSIGERILVIPYGALCPMRYGE